MDIENVTHTRPFVVPLAQNWISPEGKAVDKLLPVLENIFQLIEAWPRPYDHPYLLLRSEHSVGKDPNVGAEAGPVPQFNIEPAARAGGAGAIVNQRGGD